MQAIELFFVNFKGIGPRQIMQKSTSASSSEVTFFCAFFGGRPRFAGGFASAFFDILRFCGVFEASRFFPANRRDFREMLRPRYQNFILFVIVKMVIHLFFSHERRLLSLQVIILMFSGAKNMLRSNISLLEKKRACPNSDYTSDPTLTTFVFFDRNSLQPKRLRNQNFILETC